MRKNDIFEKEAKIRLRARRKRKIKRYMKKRIIFPFFIVLFFVAAGILAFINSLSYQTTDDAFVEGRFISIAPKVSGEVIKLYVNDNDFVKKGQLLLEIDPSDYKNKVDELRGMLKEAVSNQNISTSNIDKTSADLGQADKNLEFAVKNYKRYFELKKEGLCTKEQYDRAETNYKEALEKQSSMRAALKSSVAKNSGASANTDKIKAQLAQAELELSYTKIYAPEDGYISSRAVEQGNYVNKAQALMAIVSKEVWVVANYKETQVGKMKKGQEVSIKVDTYNNKEFKGKIDSIQLATGAKSSLFPPENAVGSYIKVVQRIPVKIVFTDDISDFVIAPGMSVVPKVKTK